MKWPSNIKIAAGASAVAVGVAGLLAQFLPVEEGRRLGAYRAPIGIPTICEGWSRGVQMGDRATQAECDLLTRQDIQEAWEVFERWVPAHVRNGMPDQTLAAFLSFIYNVGPGQAGTPDESHMFSAQVRRRLNRAPRGNMGGRMHIPSPAPFRSAVTAPKTGLSGSNAAQPMGDRLFALSRV